MAQELYIDLYPIAGPGGFQYGRIELDTLIAKHGALQGEVGVESTSPLLTVTDKSVSAATVDGVSYTNLLMFKATSPQQTRAPRVPIKISYHCQYRKSHFYVYAKLAHSELE